MPRISLTSRHATRPNSKKVELPCTPPPPHNTTHKNQGRPQDLAGGGPRIFFFRFVNLHVAKPCAMLGGFGGMLPRENFLKWCHLVRFGVYFDQILSLKNFKNYYFLYKNFKKCNFLYKRINILDTRNIILVKNFFFKFMIDAFWYIFSNNL